MIQDEDDSTRSRAKPGEFRVRLHVSYEGTPFEGWARQPAPARTVQRELESAVSRVFGRPTEVVGASRTDSGVHALQQVVHFDAPRDPQKFQDLPYSLQSCLPPEIVVQSAFLAPDEFDASWDAESKIYRYVIWNGPRPHPFRRKTALWIRRPLNLPRLQEYAEIIKGFHDFASFRNAGGSAKTSERKILQARWERRGRRVFFHVHGEGFLKQMVRNLVGTMLELEKDDRPPEALKSILEAKDRRSAGATAPPEGLFLVQIFYPTVLDNKCRKL